MTQRTLVDVVPPSPQMATPGRELRPATTWSGQLAAAGLAMVGAALGMSQLVHGAYDETTWAPITLGVLALVVAAAVAAPRLPPPALIVSLLGLWLWSLISAAWSDSTDAAHIAANRWLLYAGAVTVLWVGFAGNRRRAFLLLSCAAVGVLGVAGWMLQRMLAGAGPALFLGPRLNDPLGYVNGQAAYLLIAAWPSLAWAEHRGSRASPAIAAIGMAGLVALLGLGLLCQSRSWEAALAVVIVVLVVVVPGRRRRAAALLLAGGTVAATYGRLAGVWRHPSPVTGLVTPATTHSAALAIVVGALAAGALWGLGVFALRLFAPAGTPARTGVRWAASALFVALAFAAAVAIGARADAIAHTIHTQYEAFVHLAPGSSGGSRLVSGAGDRYDYWRVALMEFRSAPLGGVGAGNYDPGYYLHRRTTEAITQPHSLELQTLAELGLVGALLLAVFLIAVALGLRRTARSARHDLFTRGVAVAAGGMFTSWLVQTSVDWMHLIPGLTGIALAAAVALTVRRRPRPHPRAGWSRIAAAAGGRKARVAVALAAAVVAVAGTVTIAPRILSLHAQATAERDLARGATDAAIADATNALKYDSRSVTALVLRSAGFARLDDFAASLADLKRAEAAEPSNWATWALMGDLLTRRGVKQGARAAYAHALALDPLEPELKSAISTVTLKPK